MTLAGLATYGIVTLVAYEVNVWYLRRHGRAGNLLAVLFVCALNPPVMMLLGVAVAVLSAVRGGRRRQPPFEARRSDDGAGRFAASRNGVHRGGGEN